MTPTAAGPRSTSAAATGLSAGTRTSIWDVGPTAIDCSAAAPKIAQAEQNANAGPVFRQPDIETEAGLRGRRREAVDTCRRYLTGHLDQLRYDIASAAGQPIAAAHRRRPIAAGASRAPADI